MTETYWYETAPGTKTFRDVPEANGHQVSDGQVHLMRGDEIARSVPAGAHWGSTTVSEIMP
jgi:hypothetical protein